MKNNAVDAASQAAHTAVDSAASEIGGAAGSLAAPAVDAVTGSGHEAVNDAVEKVKKKGSSG